MERATKESERCAHVSAKTGERCPLEKYHAVPEIGLCLTHYTRRLRGKDMDRPLKRPKVIPLADINLRTFVVELLHEEAKAQGLPSFYAMVNDVLEKRFKDYGTRAWKPIPEFDTIDKGHMTAGTMLRAPAELVEQIRKETEKTNRSNYAMLQDIMEEWAENLLRERGQKPPDAPKRLADRGW